MTLLSQILTQWNQYDGTWRPSQVNDISIKFEIRPKFAVLCFEMYLTNHNKILHMPRQWHCCEVCKISLWSVKYILN